MAWVRERIIPTERPPLVGEVTANFCGYRVPRGHCEWFIRPYSRLSRPEPLLFLSNRSSIVLMRLSGLCSRPTTSRKIWQRRESNCSQELWPLDHRGGPLTEIRTRKCLWIVELSRRVRLSTSMPSVSRLYIQCGNIYIWQPYGPPRPASRIALPFFSDRWLKSTLSWYVATRCTGLHGVIS
jgi:hypothetical protein